MPFAQDLTAPPALPALIDFSPAASSLALRGVSLAYGDSPALRNLTLRLPRHRVTAFIDPSGCGKSTHDNVAFGLRLQGSLSKRDDIIEWALRRTGGIWLHR